MNVINKDFVDRQDELATFWKIIQQEEHERVLLVHGETGIGKTRLLDECQAQCAAKAIAGARLSFAELANQSYMSMIMCLRDQLGPKNFSPLEQAIKETRTLVGKRIGVFVSSTWIDLQTEREAVEKALHRMNGAAFAGMEYIGSRPETPEKVSLAAVDRSDVYIGLFAHRYGSGITEAEYHRARARELPCFIYFKGDDVPIHPDHIEREPEKIAKLDVLKRELQSNHTIGTFKSPDHLAALVATDLYSILVNDFTSHHLPANDFVEVIQRDDPWVQKMIQSRVTEAFCESLATLTTSRQIVFFLDAWEQATTEARDWLCANLLHWILEKKLPNAVVVLAGQNVPDFPFQARHFGKLPLAGLPDDAVQIYWEQICGLPAEQVSDIIKYSMGVPLLMYLMAQQQMKGGRHAN